VKSKVYLGIDIGGTNTKLALLTASGRLVAREMIATQAKDGAGALLERVRAAVTELLGSRRDISGAGIGCAGLVDLRTGKIYSSPNLPGWENTPISRIGSRILGVYTHIDNDANAAAYGEYRKGCGRGTAMFVCITLGTGVGGGIVNRGEVLRGSRNYAGEIGHMTIHERGPRCKCGNRGCLEAFVGTDALVHMAKRLMKRMGGGILGGSRVAESGPLTPETIARAARKGDPVGREVFDNAARHLGTAMASLVNVLNPDMIAVSGGVASGFDLMKKRIYEVVGERAFRESTGIVKIVTGQLGLDAAAVGAALMARDALHTDSPKNPRR
jgi:glucokinase